MTVGPPGEWGSILVGRYWTPQSDLTIINAASANRRNSSAAWQNFSNQLSETLAGPIGSDMQKGVTADAIRQAFRWCISHASEVSEKNALLAHAHSTSHASVRELNTQLAAIAHDGDARIREIQNSKDSGLIKVAKITDVVRDCQTQATTAAAACGQDILEAVQKILVHQGISKSSRQFMQELGMDPTRMFNSPNDEVIRQQVQQLVNGTSSPLTGGPFKEPISDAQTKVGTEGLPSPSAPELTLTNQLPPKAGTDGLLAASAPVTSRADLAPSRVGMAGLPAVPAPLTNAPMASPAPSLAASSVPTSAVAAPATALPPVSPANLALGVTPAASTPTAAGLPLSAPAGAVPPTPPAAQMPSTSPLAPQVAMAATPFAPVVETAPAAPAPVSEAPPAPVPPPSQPAPSLVAPSPVPAAPVAPAPPPHMGPLPSYGADSRPPAATPISPPAPTTTSGPAPAATPTSAPTPPTGAGPLSASMVRQPSMSSTRAPATIIGERVATATTGSAAAGTASDQPSAQDRLRRLVDFVARQQPQLAWAVGNRMDGTTLLVTDLASGWVPPGIDIPLAVGLPEPARRRGDLESLLGEVGAAASYRPQQHLLPTSGAEPVPVNSDARRGPVIDELAWELGQATKWRDGLPRLAHTLAKAATAGTGVLDSEVQLLRNNLADTAQQVLDAYPGHVDQIKLGNWQLLAVVDALIGGDHTAAHYHFAWFLALRNGR